MTKRFVFVVDTDSYSGNFERWLCGYLTGRVDEPETHGGNEAQIAKKEFPADIWEYFEDHVILCLEQPDDLPIHTPVVIYPTPGFFNHGMGGHFKEGQEKEAFKDYKKAIEKYKKDHKDSSLKASKKLSKFPAYQSVGIFFDERPSKEIIEIMKERAQKFAKDYLLTQLLGGKIKVTGFRLLQEKKKVTVSEEKV